MQLRDVDPRLSKPPGIESPTLEIAMNLGCYEFEAEDDTLADGGAS